MSLKTQELHEGLCVVHTGFGNRQVQSYITSKISVHILHGLWCKKNFQRTDMSNNDLGTETHGRGPMRGRFLLGGFSCVEELGLWQFEGLGGEDVRELSVSRSRIMYGRS